MPNLGVSVIARCYVGNRTAHSMATLIPQKNTAIGAGNHYLGLMTPPLLTDEGQMERKHDCGVNAQQSVSVMAETTTSTGPVALIVEDEFLIRANLSDVLEDGGFDIIQAANADEAIRILESRADILVVITDINMPGSLDGLRLANAIRGRWPPIELIVMSGAYWPKGDELPDRAVFFAKPYDSARLLATARHFVSG